MTEAAINILARVINDRSRSCDFCGQAIARKAVMYFRGDLPFCSMRCESGLPGGFPCKPLNANGSHSRLSWDEYCQMVRAAPDWPATQRLMQIYGTRFSAPPVRSIPLRQENARKQITIPRNREPRIRLRLFRISPHCFWCGIAVVLEADPPNRPDLATVDHLYSRWHPERESKHQQQKGVLHVLACRACNGERAVAEEHGRPFTPKLNERLEFAQRADATLAKGLSANEIRPPKGEPAPRLTFNMAETPTGRDLRMKVRDLG